MAPPLQHVQASLDNPADFVPILQNSSDENASRQFSMVLNNHVNFWRSLDGSYDTCLDSRLNQNNKKEYPTMTYVFFHIGWILFAVGITVAVVVPFFTSNNLIVALLTGICLLFGGIALKICVWTATYGRATNDTC